MPVLPTTGMSKRKNSISLAVATMIVRIAVRFFTAGRMRSGRVMCRARFVGRDYFLLKLKNKFGREYMNGKVTGKKAASNALKTMTYFR